MAVLTTITRAEVSTAEEKKKSKVQSEQDDRSVIFDSEKRQAKR